MKVLITGANGLLGQKIVKQCLKNNIDFLATSLGANRNSHCPIDNYLTLDICNNNEVIEVVKNFAPTHLIHTAAITNVDYCELNATECQQTNVEAVKYLFDAAIKNNCHFVFLSTDFVFDGLKGNYTETDQTNPLSVYAKSKYDAEQYILSSSYLNFSILRTIIVYGQAENLSRSNIVIWAKETLAKGNEIKMVNDQFRAPTWADDLAWACLRACELNAKGIFHICGPETISMYEIIHRIARFYQYDESLIQSISSETLNQAAKRPARTGFDLTKSTKVLGYSPKTLEETFKLLN